MTISREEQIEINRKEVAEIKHDLASKGIFIEHFPDDFYTSKDLWLDCVPTIKA